MDENRLIPDLTPPSAISVNDGKGIEVLRIETDGRMLWRPQGSTELEVLDIDKDLSLAFSLCVEMLSGMPYKTLMETTRKQAVQDSADTIADRVAQYLIDIKHIKPEDRDVHVRNIKNIVNKI